MSFTDKPVVMLDRDGTVIVDKTYLHSPDAVELLPFAVEGLRKLTELGLPLVIVTNQSGVGRGFFSMSEVDRVNERLVKILRQHDVEVAGIFVCPHAPNDRCCCRKPKVGLASTAAKELGLNLTTTFAIGDKACDIQLGHNLGSCTFLVSDNVANIFECERGPDFIVANLLEAAIIIEQKMNAV